MGAPSFRDILQEFLEINSDSPSAAQADHRPYATHSTQDGSSFNTWFWQAPQPTKHGRKTYPGCTSRKQKPPTPSHRAASPRPQIPTEVVLTLENLEGTDQSLVVVLINLGARELKTGVSPERLKKARRRLAKELHPDFFDQALSPTHRRQKNELFLLLQETYEGLSRALPRYYKALSDSTRDNESGAVADFRHQGAS